MRETSAPRWAVLCVEPLPDAVLPAPGAEAGATRLVLVDAIVDPATTRSWRASEIHGTAVGADPASPTLARLARIEVFENERFTTRTRETRTREDGGGDGALPVACVAAGPLRLRLTLRCHADAHRVTLWLGDRRLGDLELPDSPVTTDPHDLVGSSAREG